MKKIKISYHYIPNWYVGEIYRFFHKKLIDDFPNIYFEHVENEELKSFYKIKDYQFNIPSILNAYNFVLINPENDKTYVNSLCDHAPFCAYPKSGVENFNLQKFTFCSNFKDDLVKEILKYNPEPSFYILENYSDLEFVNFYKNKIGNIDQAIFLGALYADREKYHYVFRDSKLVRIISKHDGKNFKNKKEYFDFISDYSMMFSINGSAQICHRDIESLGLGKILIREFLDTQLNSPLIPNEHYFQVLSKEESLNILQNKELAEERINSLLQNKILIKNIRSAGLDWYEKNCLPEKQYQLLKSFIKNLEIFI